MTDKKTEKKTKLKVKCNKKKQKGPGREPWPSSSQESMLNRKPSTPVAEQATKML